MNKILARIAHYAEERPHHIALSDGTAVLTYRDLQQAIERLASALHAKRIGLLLGNGCAWAVIDLAIQRRGATCIPMPSFFSDGQLHHLIRDAELDLIVTDQASRVRDLLQTSLTTEISVAGDRLHCFVTSPAQQVSLPPHTAKITYTSGTTDQPKGVCLTGEAMESVTLSLNHAVSAGTEDRALSLLPLSTLLANIGGIYAPLYSGGTAYVPDLAKCGMSGSTGARPDQLVETLRRFQPTVIILVPYLLKMLVIAAAQGARLPASLRYIAVGGAATAPTLIERARALGLPVYQGYGLSEAASVVSLNAPGHDRRGSVGRPLPHVGVRITDDGEIMVKGNLFSAYLGQPPRSGDEWPTGDIGFFDDQGYLYITGRKSTAFATAHGRNLSPEWVESELTGNPAIGQAALFGEGRDFNVAIIVPNNGTAALKIDQAVTKLNRSLPDYARVARWIIAKEPFSVRNGLASGSGTPNREAIAVRYASQIERLYQREQSYAVL